MDVRLINRNLDVSIGLADAVKGDTANILGEAGGANETAACIDRKLNGQSGNDGDCTGTAEPQDAPRENRSVLVEDPDDLRRVLGSARRESQDDEPEQRPRRSSLPEVPGLPPLPDLPQLRELTELPELPVLPDTQKELDKLIDELLRGNPDSGQLPDALMRDLLSLPGLNQR